MKHNRESGRFLVLVVIIGIACDLDLCCIAFRTDFRGEWARDGVLVSKSIVEIHAHQELLWWVIDLDDRRIEAFLWEHVTGTWSNKIGSIAREIDVPVY